MTRIWYRNFLIMAEAYHCPRKKRYSLKHFTCICHFYYICHSKFFYSNRKRYSSIVKKSYLDAMIKIMSKRNLSKPHVNHNLLILNFLTTRNLKRLGYFDISFFNILFSLFCITNLRCYAVSSTNINQPWKNTDQRSINGHVQEDKSIDGTFNDPIVLWWCNQIMHWFPYFIAL